MIIVDLQQGSPEWHAHRAKHFNASDAPAMMGVSKYKTRSQLLNEYATGVTADIDPATQRRFADGHKAEAAAREIAERMIGEELYPVTGTLVVDGLNLSASFDGMTMDGLKCWEHKLFNKSLAESMKANQLDCEPHYHWQLEHQLLVAETDETLFMTSDGTENNCESMTYFPVFGRRAQLIAGWKQFAEDLANYQHVEVAAEAVGRAPDALPALRIEVTGMVTSSNLAEFHAAALSTFANINRDLQTDQDFANAQKAIKFCADVESRVENAKGQALSQTQSIEELFRVMDSVKAEARAVRLELEKLDAKRKVDIRAEIQREAETAFKAHIDTINARLGKVQLPAIKADFAGVMKGKKTVSSLRDACDTELARVKIEASQLSEHIGINLDFCSRVIRAEEKHLFHDLSSLVLKPQADMEAIIKMRIKEESDRIDAVAAAKIEADRQASIRAQMREQEASEGMPQPALAPVAEVVVEQVAEFLKSDKPSRPSDKQIIFAIAEKFNTDFHTASQWIKEIDFSGQEQAA